MQLQIFCFLISIFFIADQEAVILKASKNSKNVSKWNCDLEDERKVDALVGHIMTYGQADIRFPESIPELKTFCKREYGLIKKLVSYKDACLHSTAGQIVGVIAYSMKSAMANFCSRGSRNKNQKNWAPKRGLALIDSGRCANNLTSEYLGCNDHYTDQLMAVWNSTDSKVRLAQMCCGYVDVFKCVEKAARSPDKVSLCSEANIATHKDFVRSFFESAVNVICGEFNEHSDRCEHYQRVKLEVIDKGSDKNRSDETDQSAYVQRPPSYFGSLVHNLANL